jgi:Ca2+-binding EF-hand superfamily protein
MTKYALLAGLLLAATLHAQDDAKPDRNLKRARKAIKERDADGDGRLSLEEFGAGKAIFSMLDRNGDGFIGPAELAQVAPQRPQRPNKTDKADKTDRKPEGGTDRPAPDPERIKRAASGLMQRFDKNQDGKLTQDELPQGGRFDLAKADKNQDGAVDLFELTMALSERAGKAGKGKAAGKDGNRQAQAGQQLMRRLQQLDANQDGEITKDEWKGPEQYFARLDADGDGKIAKAEIKRAAKQMQGRWNNRRPDAFFNRFDADKDGKIAKDEWKMRPEIFTRLDANGDGFITKDEVRPQGPRNRRAMYGELRTGKDSAHFLAQWDKNRDGQVSSEEFPHERRFAEIDSDNDGVLSKAEIEDAMDKKDREAGYGFLERFDLNGDGMVTREEFTGPAVAFERADKNHDGVVDAKDDPK